MAQSILALIFNVYNCRDPMLTLETTPSTSIGDTVDQLRELYHAVKKKTRKREEVASYYHKVEEDGQLSLAHFASTTTSGSEQQEEEKMYMNELPDQ